MTAGSRAPLTAEQAGAARSSQERLFIEAAPGSGKTKVAAERFGLLHRLGTRGDRARAVVAVSFTRAAVAELRGRIQERWGRHVLTWPNRVVTLDSLLLDLLTHLLEAGLVRWPGGHRALTVHDKWKCRTRTACLRPALSLREADVVFGSERTGRPDRHPSPEDFEERVSAGECTHTDVRDVLAAALEQPGPAEEMARWLHTAVRALIMDEVFDANHFDLDLVRLACRTGIPTTIIGDPWQALYCFREASPEQVPRLVGQEGFGHCALTESFRFRTKEMRALSTELRAGRPAALPDAGPHRPNIVLAGWWKHLWDTPPWVLPLSFGTSKRYDPAVLLLLDRLTTTRLGKRALFVNEALADLGGAGEDAIARLAEPLSEVLEILAKPGDETVESAEHELMRVVQNESARHLRPHGDAPRMLRDIRSRLTSEDAGFVPGITVHQAKGREWDAVGIRPTAGESAALGQGLVPNNEDHRRLYVALTRARVRTVVV